MQAEIQAFAAVNVASLRKTLLVQDLADVQETRLSASASAISATVSGAQLMARGRNDLALFDALMENYRGAGLFAVES